MTEFEMVVLAILILMVLFAVTNIIYSMSLFRYITKGDLEIIEMVRKLNNRGKEDATRDPYAEAYEGDPNEDKRISTVRG